MDTKKFLEELLESSRKLSEQGIARTSELVEKGKALAQQSVQHAKDQLPPPGPERDKMLKNLGIGAAAGGLLALLVGTKSGRSVLTPAVKLGSLAALGGIGYKVYTQWQKSQGIESSGQSIVNLSGPAADERSMAIVKAMIGAAKADGQIDDDERAVIMKRIDESGLETAASEALKGELEKPLDIAAIAANADSPESAVEIYLASLILTDKTNPAEQSYLSKLSEALKLDATLVADLETQAFATA